MARNNTPEIWDCLISGKPLDALGLPMKDGRVDLSDIALPETIHVEQYATSRGIVEKIDGGAVVRDAKWHNLDFSGSELRSLRLFGCELYNCHFGDCDLRDLRMWSTRVVQTSFRRANLKDAALGGVQGGRLNSFEGVDFTEADLSQTAYKAASFSECVFSNAKLQKIDFQTTAFSECVFEGLLSHVLFYRRAFDAETFPANEMINVDFGRATLRFVEFRGLTLDRVRLPNDENHLLIRDYPAALDRLIAALGQRRDIPARKLLAYLNVLRKWAPPQQAQGVLNRDDLVDISGTEGMNLVVDLLET